MLSIRNLHNKLPSQPSGKIHGWSISFAHILCDSGVVGNIDASLLRLWKVVLADVAEAEFIELTVYQLM